MAFIHKFYVDEIIVSIAPKEKTGVPELIVSSSRDPPSTKKMRTGQKVCLLYSAKTSSNFFLVEDHQSPYIWGGKPYSAFPTTDRGVAITTHPSPKFIKGLHRGFASFDSHMQEDDQRGKDPYKQKVAARMIE